MPDTWQLDGEPARVGDIQADAQTLSLSFQAPAEPDTSANLTVARGSTLTVNRGSTRTVERNDVGRLRRREYETSGDIETVGGFGGEFRALNRGTTPAVTVTPPDSQSPPFTETQYLVDGYSEDQLAPDRVAISLDLQRTTNRTQQFSPVSESGEIELALSSGRLGLAAEQVSTVPRDGSTTGPELSVLLTVDDDQAATLLDTLGFPAAVVERAIADGQSVLQDTSPNSRQTVTVTRSATSTALPAGEYLIPDWSLEFAGYADGRRWRFEATLAESN